MSVAKELSWSLSTAAAAAASSAAAKLLGALTAQMNDEQLQAAHSATEAPLGCRGHSRRRHCPSPTDQSIEYHR